MKIALAPFGKVTLEVLLERDLAIPVKPILARIPLAIREAAEADLDRITLLYSHDTYLYLGDEPPAQSHAGVQVVELGAREQYRDRMRRGEKCFLAFVGDEIAHVNWLCLSWAEAVPGHPIYLQAEEVYTTDAITPTSFAGTKQSVQLSLWLRPVAGLYLCPLQRSQPRSRRRSLQVQRRELWSLEPPCSDESSVEHP